MATMVPPTPATENKVDEKVDYFDLPCPIPFEELHREAMSTSPFFISFQYFSFFVNLNFAFCLDLSNFKLIPDVSLDLGECRVPIVSVFCTEYTYTYT